MPHSIVIVDDHILIARALTSIVEHFPGYQMVEAGVNGYISKNIHPTEFEKALNTLVEKRIYFPDWATSHVFKHLRNSKTIADTSIVLSEKEKTFLQYACAPNSPTKKSVKKCFAVPAPLKVTAMLCSRSWA